jgi:hypothetical protein
MSESVVEYSAYGKFTRRRRPGLGAASFDKTVAALVSPRVPRLPFLLLTELIERNADTKIERDPPNLSA